jgi:predicted metal-dependent phosphoesterase TrpH
LIDLHTHTYESDGSLSPRELIDAAMEIGLQAMAITDHDTFAGFDAALPYARERGLDLVCGIELSCKLDGHTTHLLGYFVHGDPGPQFRGWLDQLLTARRDRNRRLAERLQSVGLDIRLEEVERLGRTLTGRPHFARVLVEKGYVKTRDEAFKKYIGEHGKAFVEREGPTVEQGIEKIADARGLSSLAHPVRVEQRDPGIADIIGRLAAAGMAGLEVWHTDHNPKATEQFLAIAEKNGLTPTGGSDFHGEAKPNVRLGSGANGRLRIPVSVLEAMRQRSL